MTTTRHDAGPRSIALLGAIVALFAAFLPSWAAADGDGGGRSVFAAGAGNRALGLGGAFCAVADDASAAVWNPGGLGWVARKQFLATQTTLFGLGFNEQFAAFVVPNHRLGTTSFVMRRFAVDGIEGRDDRGALSDEDLQDSEVELALGYGHTLGGSISVGAALKMQRQSLAGYQDSGLGVDIGFLSRPLQLIGIDDTGGGLTFGAAVRNAVEPSLRLDVDNVPDPTAVRSGLAYRTGLGESLGVLMSLDVEKTRQMDSRLHAGCEAVLYDLLSVRAGSFAGALTAGASVRWNGIGVDYQFEDNPVGQIHRLGLGLVFGSTVEESRDAARLAESIALQTHLDAAFEERTRTRAAGVAGEARQALVDQRWDRALDLAGTLMVLSPDDANTAALVGEAWRGRGAQEEASGDLVSAALSYSKALAEAPADSAASVGLARVRREGAERADRTRDLRARFEAALDAFARDELMTAQAGFAEMLRLSPGDQEATSMLERTTVAIGRRGAALRDRVESLLGAGRLDDAASALEEARRFAPDHPDLAALSKNIKTRQTGAARDAATSTTPLPVAIIAAPAPVSAPLSQARQREIADLYHRGVEALDAGRSEDAIRYWEMVWAADPAYSGVSDHLAQEYLTLGMEAFAAGKLAKAVDHWEQAVRVSPRDARARGYLDRAHEQLSRMQSITTRR